MSGKSDTSSPSEKEWSFGEKKTSDFKNFADYKEVKDRTTSGPVLIGFIAYETPAEKEGKTFLSSPGQTVRRPREELERDGRDSPYLGRVLNPAWRNDEWSYEGNQAFLAGVIDSKAQVLILSDINRAGALGRVTADELLILKDNGYTFKPNPRNPVQTIAEPPAEKSAAVIKNYFQGRRTSDFGEYMPDKAAMMSTALQEIKNSVIEQRKNLLGVTKNDTEVAEKREKTIAHNPRPSVLQENKEKPQQQEKVADDNTFSLPKLK